jgi:hypothetical protein
MNRRDFLQYSSTTAGIAVIGGGLWARKAYGSYKLQQNLVESSSPILLTKAHNEFQSVPVKGREEIREWFHGKALNVAPFVKEICSNNYREKLHRCKSEDEQRTLLLVSFCGKVATDAEILNRVQMIAEEVCQELNTNWGECCKTISSEWNLHIKDYGQPLELSEFVQRVDQMVKQHFAESLEMARVGTEYPAFGETIGNIAQAGLMVLPMSRIRVSPVGVDMNHLAIPTFFLLALDHFIQYIIGLFSDPRPDLQRAISANLSLLGNRIGSEFESFVRASLGNLHGWQDQAVRLAAQQYADSVVGWL